MGRIGEVSSPLLVVVVVLALWGVFNVFVDSEGMMVPLFKRPPDARDDENDLDCLRSAYAVNAPPGVGFGGCSLEEGNVNPSPKASNLVTKAAKARLSSSNFSLVYTTHPGDTSAIG